MTRITIEELDEVFRLFESSDFDELTIESGDMRVHVARNGAGVPSGAASSRDARPAEASSAQTPQGPAAPGAQTDPAPVAETSVSGASSAVQAVDGAQPITAVVSGTFYRSPSPTADPFVEVGARVSATDTVGLVEVMKLFTSIPAGFDGEVVEIVAENGAAVQAGDVLMFLKVDG
ncbi:MAG: biotin carboxyl carrier domain-containing protein [Proteobacteria bacterium]|nr:MAG: biotin carboxyl carrier domain-containing protein [Pseudomonadota bacterium]